MKTCIYCKETKPFESFYLRPDGRNYNSACKDCMRKKSKEQSHTSQARLISTVASEQGLIAELHKRGIPALPGKAMSQAWADIIAYGIVRIEVKISKINDDGTYHWHFTSSQIARGIKGDIIALIEKRPNGLVHHFLTPDSIAFFNQADQRKTAVVYPVKRAWGVYGMSNEAIRNHTENWGLIPQVFELLCQQLASGEFDMTKSYL